MKTRHFPTFILLGVLLAACAPSAAPAITEVAQGGVQPAPVEATAAQPAAVDPASTQPAVADVPPVATSRGPNLEATDPAAVSLASGGLHFVEFFRFT
jgi:hypothetical protein